MSDSAAPDCAFCDVVSGSARAHEVLRDDVAVGFLDRSPLFVGHVLVVPVEHHATLTDLPVDVVGLFFDRVRRVAVAVETAMAAAGSFVAINNRVSQSVPHLHVHVVPRNRGDGLRGFFWPRHRYDHETHMAETASAIATALAEVVVEPRSDVDEALE